MWSTVDLPVIGVVHSNECAFLGRCRRVLPIGNQHARSWQPHRPEVDPPAPGRRDTGPGGHLVAGHGGVACACSPSRRSGVHDLRQAGELLPPLGRRRVGSLRGRGFRARMLEHEARIGRQLDIVHEYLGAATVLTDDMVTLAKRPGTIALVNWRVAGRWANGDGRSATVNNQIDAMAEEHQGPRSTKIMLAVLPRARERHLARRRPQLPGDAFSGSSGTVTDYVDMWHNVRSRFDALGVTNVVWVMNYMGWKDGTASSRTSGRETVRRLGEWDPYPKTATWTSFVNTFYDFLIANNDATHDFVSKPWGLAEYGYVGSSQTAAYAMYDEARRNLQNGVHPRLKAYVVWDNHTSSSHDDRVGYTRGRQRPDRAAALQRLRQRPTADPRGDTRTVDRTRARGHSVRPRGRATVGGPVTVTGTPPTTSAVESVDPARRRRRRTATPDAEGTWRSTGTPRPSPNGPPHAAAGARDASGNTGLSDEVTVTVENVDEEPPTPPARLTGTWGTPGDPDWSAAERQCGRHRLPGLPRRRPRHDAGCGRS